VFVDAVRFSGSWCHESRRWGFGGVLERQPYRPCLQSTRYTVLRHEPLVVSMPGGRPATECSETGPKPIQVCSPTAVKASGEAPSLVHP